MTSWRQDKKGVEKTTTSNETSHSNNKTTTRHRASRSDEIPEPFLVTPPRSRSRSMDDPFVLDASHDDDDDGFAFDDDPFADFDEYSVSHNRDSPLTLYPPSYSTAFPPMSSTTIINA
eukprot:scaffold9280_cov44-Cylindrotheca_fusiformis.AAC.1